MNTAMNTTMNTAMNTTMNTFKELAATYTTSDTLFAWLKSPAGGRLLIHEDHTTPVALIHYDKKVSDLTLNHVPHFRSVVWNMHTNLPVSIAPPRGASIAILTDADMNGAIIEDFVDGIMINMFYDNGWRIASKTQVDAPGHFYGPRSFSELFWETFNSKGLGNTEQLDTTVCYSWVLQHPQERIVVAPTYGIPGLWLISAHRIDLDGTVQELVDVLPSFRPVRHALETADQVRDRVNAWGHRFGHGWQGLVVKTADGRRFKGRTAEYTAARALRGNQAKLPFLWLERWSEGRLTSYLKIYPEEAVDADAVVGRFKAATQELYDLYQRVYRRLELPLGQAPRKYRKLLWEARAANAGGYFKDLRAFMNNQDVARKLWLVNYETRYSLVTPDSVPEPSDTRYSLATEPSDTRYSLATPNPVPEHGDTRYSTTAAEQSA
jgi:hypothetical protein